MSVLKVTFFLLGVIACLILLIFYAGWSFTKLAIFLGVASVFTGLAYYLYKNMFTEDE